jgi:uncharacterized protein with HEPN domain
MKHNIIPVIKKHIIELNQILGQYAATDKKSFVAIAEIDKVFQKAVLMDVGYIGELSKKLDEEFRLKHTEINWRRLSTSRNIVFHDYDIVDMNIISTVVYRDIMALQSALSTYGD